MTKIYREKRTVLMMVEIYCRYHHKTNTLCDECNELVKYAHARLDRCPFGEEKGVCSKCKIHCYKPTMRTKIAQVMRFSGKRMIFYSPTSAIRHLIQLLFSK